MCQRMVELDSAARHPRMVPALDDDVRIVGELLTRLIDLAVADEGKAGKDQRLRAGPAFGEAAVDK